MSDVNSSLPVRTQTNGDVVAKIADGTLPSQLLAVDASGRVTVKGQDGAGNDLTSQSNGAQRALDVGINVLGVQVDPRAVRALTASDVVTAQQGNAPWTQNITQVLGAAPSATNALATQIATGGAYVSSANPLPVAVSPAPTGTLVNKYNTSSAIASGASTNHDYTITASKTFTGKKFWISASGKVKADISTSVDGTTFLTSWTSFNSTANPNISVDLGNLAIQGSGTGAKIRIVITNLDLLAQDVYSTISGSEA